MEYEVRISKRRADTTELFEIKATLVGRLQLEDFVDRLKSLLPKKEKPRNG